MFCIFCLFGRLGFYTLRAEFIKVPWFFVCIKLNCFSWSLAVAIWSTICQSADDAGCRVVLAEQSLVCVFWTPNKPLCTVKSRCLLLIYLFAWINVEIQRHRCYSNSGFLVNLPVLFIFVFDFLCTIIFLFLKNWQSKIVFNARFFDSSNAFGRTFSCWLQICRQIHVSWVQWFGSDSCLLRNQRMSAVVASSTLV